MAPRSWRRPLTLIYNDNYRYGNSLYSSAIEDIERKYHDAISRTNFRSDRPDLGFSSFSRIPTGSRPGSPMRIAPPSSAPEMRFGTSWTEDDYGRRARSAFSDVDRYSLKDRFDVWSSSAVLGSQKIIREEIDAAEERRARRRRRRRMERDTIMDNVVRSSSASLMDYKTDCSMLDRCRELQTQLETVLQRVDDAEVKLKKDIGANANKMQIEIKDLGLSLEGSNLQTAELQKVLKKQAKQLAELQSLQEEVLHQIGDANEHLNASSSRCHGLQADLNNLRTSVEMAAGVRSPKTF